MTQLPVFDRGEALRRLLNSEKLLREVINIFLRDLPRLNLQMKSAIESKSASAVGLAAHSLKGSVSQIGGRVVAERAWQIEQAVQKGNMPAVVDLYPPLNDEINNLVKILESELTKDLA